MSAEQIVELGHGMFGLLSRPPDGIACDTAVVLFNAGILHRPGPFRTNVLLSRALAALGYATLRFDMPGVGDSLQFADRSLEQTTRAVLDRLQDITGCQQFVVGGICSAADVGWKLALADSRVAGILMIDGLARKGLWFTIARAARAIRTPLSAWPGKLRRHVARAPVSTETVENLRDWPVPGETRPLLAKLLGRGVKVLMIYTGGTSYFLHARQFRSTFGANADSAAIDFHFWPRCDHMFFSVSDRKLLITATGNWMSRCFWQDKALTQAGPNRHS